MHLSASISAGKTPMNATAMSIALGSQRHNMLPHVFRTADPFGQATPLEDTDLDLSHIEPTAMLRRIMHLQSLPDALGFLSRKRFVEAGRRMGVEIIHHQTNHLGIGIDLID